jgi:hypothetical protein
VSRIVISNRTAYDDRRVERLVLLGIGDQPLEERTIVEVSEADKPWGYTRRDIDGQRVRLVIVNIPKGGGVQLATDGSSSARTAEDWLVWLTAHEVRHIVQSNEGLELSEQDACSHAEDQLRWYRELERQESLWPARLLGVKGV